MSPNKRKILASDKSNEDDSFKHRRSSLRVNLSYSENLTDSGNGSLWRTEIVSKERETDAAQTRGRLSRRKSTHEKDHRSDLDNEDAQAVSDTSKCAANNDGEMSARVKEGMQLKRLTINLEDISTKERYLEASCKHLKDVILCKTQEIFDRENVLSIKTALVLGNEENHFASTNNPNDGNKTIILDTTNRHLREKAAEEHELTEYTLGNGQREDPYSNIVATPTNSDGRRSLERNVDKSRLTPRQLFVGKDRSVEGQAKCKIIKDIILKKSFPLLSLRQADQNGSPILSGSNRRLSLLRARSNLHSQNQPESHNNTHSTVHSVRNIDIGAPVVCSTFIEDNALDERETSSDMDVSRAAHTTNKVMSMEMTEVHGGIREERMSLQNRNTNNENSKEERSKGGSTERKQNAITARVEDAEHPANEVAAQNNIAHSCTNDANDRDMASVYIDTVIPIQTSIEELAVVTKTRDILQAHECGNRTKHQSGRRLSLSDSSNNTIRSSLNVNTSLDAMTEASKARDVRKANRYRTNGADQDYETTISNKESIALNEHESASTTRTSLQMNTSVDSMRKTWQRESDSLSKRSLVRDKDDKHRISSNTDREYSTETESKEKNNIDFLENVSLIERLRNISLRNQVSHNDKSRASKMRDEDTRRASNSGDSYSYVEGTPYPISRSVLFKSQLKHKTQNLDDAASCSGNLNSMDNEGDNDKTKSVASHSNEMLVSTETQKTTEADTLILEGTLSGDPFVTQNQLMIIKDKPDGTEPETDEKNTAAPQNTECIPVRKGRRRLLPLHESSQLCSITPVDEKRCTPEESTSAKRNKRLKKRPKRKSIRSKNNINNVKRNIISEQTWSDSDCDMPENKRKEIKKTRKPRKVISKKIRIKKFVDESLLNILQGNKQNKEDHSTENRDSFDDFVKCRTISTQRNKPKSQKIVIVTTGLSKGDKSLVRSIVNSLGAAEMELNVSRRTTHVVSTGVRTVNLLRGIIRGCWLVTLEWVLKSLDKNAWLNPETFEMKHFSKAVQENRKDRQLFGPSYIPELFTACGFIYVERKTAVPCDTLKELIKTAGGHITENTKLAKIIIGSNGLKDTWVIDSITTGEPQLTKLYQRK